MAGLIDGEGYIGLQNSAVVEVESVSPALVTTPAELFGGRVSSHLRGDTRIYRWRAHGQTAVNLLKVVLPFLRYKAEQAMIVRNGIKYPPRSAMRQAISRRLLHLRKLRYQ